MPLRTISRCISSPLSGSWKSIWSVVELRLAVWWHYFDLIHNWLQLYESETKIFPFSRAWDLGTNNILGTHLSGLHSHAPNFPNHGGTTPNLQPCSRLLGCWGVFFVLQSSLLLCMEICFSLAAHPLAFKGQLTFSLGPECLRGVSLSSPAESPGFGSGKSGWLVRRPGPSPDFDSWTLEYRWWISLSFLILLSPESGCSQLAGASIQFRRGCLSAFLPLLPTFFLLHSE